MVIETVPDSVTVLVALCVWPSGPVTTMSICALSLPVPISVTGTLNVQLVLLGVVVTEPTARAREGVRNMTRREDSPAKYLALAVEPLF